MYRLIWLLLGQHSSVTSTKSQSTTHWYTARSSTDVGQYINHGIIVILLVNYQSTIGNYYYNWWYIGQLSVLFQLIVRENWPPAHWYRLSTVNKWASTNTFTVMTVTYNITRSTLEWQVIDISVIIWSSNDQHIDQYIDQGNLCEYLIFHWYYSPLKQCQPTNISVDILSSILLMYQLIYSAKCQWSISELSVYHQLYGPMYILVTISTKYQLLWHWLLVGGLVI